MRLPKERISINTGKRRELKMKKHLPALFVFTLIFLFNAPPTNGQSDAELTAQYDSLITSQFKQDEPGGVVLVSRKGEIIYERAFGMANLELDVPMEKDFVFPIASITKQFTAVAVLREVERGIISLSDTVGKFLTEYPEHLRKVTIEQLMTHTSGVPNAKSIASLLAIGRGWLTAEQIMATFKDQPLDFTPGAQWAYSNSGYQLLGYVLERAVHAPYPEFMDSTVLRDAGMTRSFYGNDMKIVKHRASSYLYTRMGIENASGGSGNIQIAFAAGAIESTAEDMFKWSKSLVAGKLIRPETLKKAWTRAHLNDGSPTDYGYGWFIGELQGSPLVEHGGNMGGFMSHAIYLPQEDVYVVALFNFRGKLPEILTTQMASMAIGKPLNLNPVKLPEETLQSYAGRYKDAGGFEITIIEENGKLFYQKEGRPKWALTPYAKDKFVFDNTSTIGEMQRDGEGNITSFAMQTTRGAVSYTHLTLPTN
jgi:CubicO group peptidase (beta-lactamase class C family)